MEVKYFLQKAYYVFWAIIIFIMRRYGLHFKVKPNLHQHEKKFFILNKKPTLTLNMRIILILLTELISSLVTLIWASAMLGFSYEANKNTKVTFEGRFFGLLSVFLAFMPAAITTWTAWKYYSSNADAVPLGLWLPAIVNIISIPLCLGIVYLYDISFEEKKGLK